MLLVSAQVFVAQSVNRQRVALGGEETQQPADFGVVGANCVRAAVRFELKPTDVFSRCGLKGEGHVEAMVMIINEPPSLSASLTPMPRFIPIFLVALVAACGGASKAPSGPTASTVAVQQADVPTDMVRCDLSGDIQSFIQKEQVPDPSTSKSAANEWSQAQTNGATAAYAAIYTDSKSHCTDFANGRSDPAAVPYRLVIAFVLQFKDTKSAANTYSNDSIFG